MSIHENKDLETHLLSDIHEQNQSSLSILENRKIIQHEDSIIRHLVVQDGNETFEFLVRIIDKSAQSRRIRKQSSFQSLYVTNEVENAMDHIEIFKYLDHPNILQLYALRNCDPFVISFEEWCETGPYLRKVGDLTYSLPKHHPNPYSEDELVYIFWDIAKALYYLHQKQVCHLNIRPDYFLHGNKTTAKLAGFANLSNIHDDIFRGLRDKFPGSTLFQAPECFREGLLSSYSADLWSLGACFYYYVFNKPPIMSTNLLELGINATDYACLPEMNGISDELRDLLSGMLHPTISERSSLEDVLKCNWFKKYNLHFEDCEKVDSTPIHCNRDLELSDWTKPAYMKWNHLFDKIISILIQKNKHGVMEQQSSSYGLISSTSTDSLSATPSATPFLDILAGNSHSQSASTLSINARIRGSFQNKIDRDCHICHQLNISLPKEEDLQIFNESCSCCFSPSWMPWWLFLKGRLYVEKGKAVVTFFRKSTQVSIDLEHALLIEHPENPQLFEIMAKTGDLYLFKTATVEARIQWERAISYAIRLSKV